MKIGILGGSFDPPHIGHVLVVQQIIERLNLDRIVLMPVFSHPFEKKLSLPKHRLSMAKFLETKSIEVSNFEIKQGKVSYSIDTLNYLSKAHPRDSFFWIIGAEQLEEFDRWKKWEEIIKRYSLIIFPRDPYGYELEKTVKKFLSLKTIPKNMILMNQKDLLVTNVSSTIIRERVKKGFSIEYLVPKKVEKYIKDNNLYLNASFERSS